MTRQFWVKVHRYAGLYMAVFLLVAGLTGSVLAFEPELDHWLNPPTKVAIQNRPMMDPMDLRERALALLPPQGRIHFASLHPKPDVAYTLGITPIPDPATGKPAELPFTLLKLDPYTGAELERSKPVGEGLWPITRRNFIGVILSLHFRLLIPGSVGVWLFGIAALIWTVDCFVSAYLTFPVSVERRQGGEGGAEPAPRKSWLARWKPSWLVHWKGSTFRINFDLHRAGGLWVWLLLFPLAWSSVAFNLRNQVYLPVMKVAFHMPDLFADSPDLKAPDHDPKVGWREARALGRRLMAEHANSHGFQTEYESAMQYVPEKGLYFYAVRSNRDLVADYGLTYVAMDGITGTPLGLNLPRGQNPGPTFHNWISALHMGSVWGLPYRMFLSFTGLVIGMLSLTGVYLWWKKRSAKKLVQLQRKKG